MLKKYLFSIIVALIIMYLSLASSDTFKKVPVFDITNLDKIVHFLMYFGLMSVLIFDSRKTLKKTESLLLLALIPLCYGILMEFLQSALTTSRTSSFYDVVSNSVGILVSLLIWLKIKPFMKEKIR
jgi:VanZ family protein